MEVECFIDDKISRMLLPLPDTGLPLVSGNAKWILQIYTSGEPSGSLLYLFVCCMRVIDRFGHMKDRRMSLAFLYKYGESTCFFYLLARTHARTQSVSCTATSYLANRNAADTSCFWWKTRCVAFRQSLTWSISWYGASLEQNPAGPERLQEQGCLPLVYTKGLVRACFWTGTLFSTRTLLPHARHFWLALLLCVSSFGNDQL